MKAWYSRPSGHSSTIIIIGKFADQDIAAAVAESLRDDIKKEKLQGDWEDWNVSHEGDEVSFNAYTETSSVITDFLYKKGVKDIRYIDDPQNVIIEFEFDTPEASAEEIKTLLLLQHPDLVSIYIEAYTLTESVEHREGKTIFRINYFGSCIYDEEQQLLLVGESLKVGRDINCKIYT